MVNNHTTDPTAVVLHGDYAAGLADLLRGLHAWIDAEHHQLDPLLAKHHYDPQDLRNTLDLYAALLHSPDDRSPF